MKDTILFLLWEHPNLVTQNFIKSIGLAFGGYNQNVVIISVSKPVQEQFQLIDFSRLSCVFYLGHLPLNIQVNDKPLYNYVDCPVYVYELDTPTYNIRNQCFIDYVNASASDNRLRILFGESNYLDLFSKYEFNGKKPRFEFMPFASFPTIPKQVEKQHKAVVIGGLGTELYSFGSSLVNTIENADCYGISRNKKTQLVDALDDTSFRGTVAKYIFDILELDPSELMNPKFLELSSSVDAHIKNRNRIRAIDSLKDFPTDFYGPGWDKRYGDVKNFTFKGEINHTEIADTASQYKVLLNFDPNWENGSHDRVFTTLSAGTNVITNHNDFDVGAKTYKYYPNVPNIKELAEEACSENIHIDTQNILLNHSWHNRITKLMKNI